MTAAVKDRDTQQRQGVRRALPVLAATLLYAGVMAVVGAAGFLTNASTAVGLRCVGVTRGRIDNSTGANGAVQGEVERGVFGPFANSAAADQIALSELGQDCYIVDNQTVAKTNGGATRSVAGKVFDVNPDGVWVEFV